MWQLACYALLDFPDEYHLDSAAFYMARQGRLVEWTLNEFFAALTGEPVAVSVLRQELSDVVYGVRRPVTRHPRVAGPVRMN